MHTGRVIFELVNAFLYNGQNPLNQSRTIPALALRCLEISLSKEEGKEDDVIYCQSHNLV